MEHDPIPRLDAPRASTRPWKVAGGLIAVALVTATLVQCGRASTETAARDVAPTTSESTTTTTQADTTTSTSPPVTEPPPPPVTFPPPPDDLADPEEPGVIFEHNDVDIADAAIVWDPDSSIYRLYSTNHASENIFENRNVQMWTSPNLREWTLVGDAMPTMPAWAQPGRTWAPEIHRFGDRWVLYPTVWDRASGRQCIAYASAPTAAGPFVPDDSGPVICQLDRYGSIDASIFTDLDQAKWILWKSEENAFPRTLGPTQIHSQRVDGRGVPFGPSHVLLRGDDGWTGGLVESPSMVWGSLRYWLVFSGGWGHTERYSVGVVECAGPAGPCQPPTDDKVLIRTNRQGKGPGEQGAVHDRAGNLWLAYNPSAPFLDGGIRPLALAHIKFAWFGPYVADPPAGFWR